MLFTDDDIVLVEKWSGK